MSMVTFFIDLVILRYIYSNYKLVGSVIVAV